MGRLTEHEMDVWGGWVRIFLLSVMWILIRTGLSIMGGLRDSNPHIENAGTCPRGINTLQNEGFFNQVSNQQHRRFLTSLYIFGFANLFSLIGFPQFFFFYIDT